MGKIARYLNQLTIGNVFDAPEVLEAYSTDRSALKIKPRFVALPESTDDVQKLMKFFYQLAARGMKIPLAVRGSGLDQSGADLSNGLVISTEKLNRLLEADRRERLVRVQAGITLKELNTALSVNGLTIPVGNHDAETIGGLISNCPTDSYSGKYGGIMNYVERAEIVLTNGEVLQTNRFKKGVVKKKSRGKTLEASIYRKIPDVMKANEALIKEIQKNNNGSYGYPTIAQVKRGRTIDILPFFFGAEGTLGVITEVILRAVPIKTEPRRVVATFESLAMAQKFLDLANSMKPRQLDIYDLSIIKVAEESGKRVSELTKKMPSGYAVFACFDDKANSCLKKLNSVKKVLPRSTKMIFDTKENKVIIDEFENSLANYLNNTRGGERVPLLTDFYLPARNLQNFVYDLDVLRDSLKIPMEIYGSYSSSNYSLRPKFDIGDPNFNKTALGFMRAGAFVIERQGGSVTGGSPEGRVKALVADGKISEAERNLYGEIKAIFDRYDILNPGVKLGADSRYTLSHFRSVSPAKLMI